MKNNKKPERKKLHKPYSMHIEIDVEWLMQGDGAATFSPEMLIDQVENIFVKAKGKGVKISFKAVMSPQIKESTTWKKEG
jgi:hypothetical protein